MVKLTQPLGSSAAHGHIGTSIIFQGTTAKAFRKPRNPNTPAQAAQRESFREITRTLRAFKPWARGALRSQLGVNWWSKVLSIVNERWATSSSEFDAFGLSDRAAWLADAPYEYTTTDAGKIFYAMSKAIYEYFAAMQLHHFGLPAPVGNNSTSVGAWFSQDLSSALMPGGYDDDHPNFIYSGPGHWDHHVPQEIEMQVFFGVTYSWTISEDSPSVEFYFFGNQIRVYYWRAVGYGGMAIDIDNLATVTVSQSQTPYLTLVEWASDLFYEGLHFAKISQVGVTHPIYFDGVIVSGTG